LFSNGESQPEQKVVGDLYEARKDEDGWLYLDFIVDSPISSLRGFN